jgi:hypothetical protein
MELMLGILQGLGIFIALPALIGIIVADSFLLWDDRASAKQVSLGHFQRNHELVEFLDKIIDPEAGLRLPTLSATALAKSDNPELLGEGHHL